MSKKYNWEEVQKEYDKGLTYKELCAKFGFWENAIHKAVLRGDLKPRTNYETFLLKKANKLPEEQAKALLAGEQKICTICKKLLPILNFNKNKSRKDGLQLQCRDCSQAKSREYYKRNPQKQKLECSKRRKRVRKEIQEKIYQILATSSCVDCGETNPLTLDFDHIRDKDDNVSNMIMKARKWEVIEEEIKKCEVRCANCHRIKTARECNSYRYKKLMGAGAVAQ